LASARIAASEVNFSEKRRRSPKFVATTQKTISTAENHATINIDVIPISIPLGDIPPLAPTAILEAEQ